MKKAIGIISKILVGAACLCLAGIIILNVSLFVSQHVSSAHQMEIFGIYPLVVKTDSMNPVFASGDLIFSKSTDGDEVSVGDIVSFINVNSEKEVIVTHRIVEKELTENGIRYSTKGDANPSIDAYPLSGTNVLGTYMGRIPKLGVLITFLQTPLGLGVSLGLIVLTYISVSLYTKNKRLREEKDISRGMTDK